MQGRREPSFFLTKKNPAPAVEDEWQMSPALMDSWMYLSIASRSGPDREKRRPRGGEVPGRRSMTQSNGRWGGSEVAQDLLKTSRRSRYSFGTLVKSAASTCNTGDTDTGGEATPRQHAWQDWLQDIIWLWDQSTWGLCWTNQGCPRTRLALGDSMRNSTTDSRWLPDTTRLTQGVVCVIVATGWPETPQTVTGEERGMPGMPQILAMLQSRKLASAPESIRALQEWTASW